MGLLWAPAAGSHLATTHVRISISHIRSTGWPDAYRYQVRQKRQQYVLRGMDRRFFFWSTVGLPAKPAKAVHVKLPELLTVRLY
jgi:hypothetical protein